MPATENAITAEGVRVLCCRHALHTSPTLLSVVDKSSGFSLASTENNRAKIGLKTLSLTSLCQGLQQLTGRSQERGETR